jgi:hypothetical protein
MTTFRETTLARRDRLALPGSAAKAANGVAKVLETETPVSPPQKRPHAPFDPGKHVREFAFPDGRPISIHRHGVRFACPLKDDPENLTLVGLKDGEKPVPLRVSYADFKAWWVEDRRQRK